MRPRTVDRDEVRRLAALGLSQREAAQAMGCCDASISIVKRKIRVVFRRGRPGPKASAARLQVEAMARAGFSAGRILAALGCDKTLVYRVLRALRQKRRETLGRVA